MEKLCWWSGWKDYSLSVVSPFPSESRKCKLGKFSLCFKFAFQYIENVNSWSSSCEIQQVSSDITVLEQSIHHHQSLYEGMCQAYTEVGDQRNFSRKICQKTRIKLHLCLLEKKLKFQSSSYFKSSSFSVRLISIFPL